MNVSGSQNSNSSIFSSEEAIASGLRVTWAGMLVNVVLIIIKLWVGLLSKSQALIADGIHSFSDLFSDFVVIVGLKWGRKTEDEAHPFGHGRIETISSMIVGLLLFLVGVGIGYKALHSIYSHTASNPGWGAIGAAAFSIVLKEVLYWYTIAVGRRIKSSVIIGNAWHHRTDALTSVAVLIGVTATYVNPSWQMADSLAALVVTVFVLRVGVKLIWEALKELIDTAPEAKVIADFAEVAMGVDGVRQVHDIRARLSGSQIFVEMDIVVKPDLTVRQGHDVAVLVKRAIMERFADVTRVKIHVDPEIKEYD